MWAPISYCNLNRETHTLVNQFFGQLKVFDGLQWVLDYFGHRYLQNYMWWRSLENNNEKFTLEDFEESWVAVNNFISLHETAANDYFLNHWTFDSDSVDNDYLDPTPNMFFDQVRFFFMARSIEFCKQSNEEVQAILMPLLKEYWHDDNTTNIYPVMRLMINNPTDRVNVTELLGDEPAWIDTFTPPLTKGNSQTHFHSISRLKRDYILLEHIF